MNFTESLKKNYQFKFVYNKGNSIANKYLVMYLVKNNSSLNRLGISVSKKVGNSVTRSRTTRLIRESYRLNEKYIKRGYDIVIVARNLAKGALYKDINNSLKYLLKKHKILNIK